MSEAPLYMYSRLRSDLVGGEQQGQRKEDARLPGKGNSKSHGARPVHLIITMIKWILTSRLSIKNSLSVAGDPDGAHLLHSDYRRYHLRYEPQKGNDD